MPKSPAKAPSRALNAQQRKFALEYLVDGNGTAAATRAGYSAKTAASQACDLLKNVKIKAIIDAGFARKQRLLDAAAARAAEKYEVTQERWLAEVGVIAFADMDKYATVEENGSVTIIPTEERAVSGRAIKKVSHSRGKNGSQKAIELHNKLAALELIAKHKGFIKDRTELSGDLSNPVKVNITLPANGREAPKPPLPVVKKEEKPE